MQPVKYVLHQDGVRPGRPVYQGAVLGKEITGKAVDDDPHCLARLKHYPSLVPMAQDARKPVYALKPADGAFGGHQAAVMGARADFAVLARVLAERIGVALPPDVGSRGA